MEKSIFRGMYFFCLALLTWDEYFKVILGRFELGPLGANLYLMDTLVLTHIKLTLFSIG